MLKDTYAYSVVACTNVSAQLVPEEDFINLFWSMPDVLKKMQARALHAACVRLHKLLRSRAVPECMRTSLQARMRTDMHIYNYIYIEVELHIHIPRANSQHGYCRQHAMACTPEERVGADTST